MNTVLSKWRDWHIIAFENKVIVRNLHQAKNIFASLEKLNQARVGLDLSKTNYIDSSAITLIINLQKALNDNGGEVVIYGINDDIREVFTLVSLGDCIKIFESRELFEVYAAGAQN
jgi:anti-anti-sigma factor